MGDNWHEMRTRFAGPLLDKFIFIHVNNKSFLRMKYRNFNDYNGDFQNRHEKLKYAVQSSDPHRKKM